MSQAGLARTVNVSPQALADIIRLEEFSFERQDPMGVDLHVYLMNALRLLEQQPGVGRPAGGDLRELIIERGRSGYLARYRYQRGKPYVMVLRIRHQSESGYTADEI